MKRWIMPAAAFGLVAAQAAWSQTHRPYGGLETRPIKALSEQQIADLKAGRGMGMALAAERNGYPGPLHVLELADQLGLTPAQRARMAELVAAMAEKQKDPAPLISRLSRTPCAERLGLPSFCQAKRVSYSCQGWASSLAIG